MAQPTSGGIFGDIVLHFIKANNEWCAAYPPEELYGYGFTQEAAMRNLRCVLRMRRSELRSCIAALEAECNEGKGRPIDLTAYRRHRLAHAIQTAQSDCEEGPP